MKESMSVKFELSSEALHISVKLVCAVAEREGGEREARERSARQQAPLVLRATEREREGERESAREKEREKKKRRARERGRHTLGRARSRSSLVVARSRENRNLLSKVCLSSMCRLVIYVFSALHSDRQCEKSVLVIYVFSRRGISTVALGFRSATPQGVDHYRIVVVFFFFFITLGLELSDTTSSRALDTSPPRNCFSLLRSNCS